MVYTEDFLREKLTKELEPTHIEITDTSDGCGAKFVAVIVSEKFLGKPLLQQHRLVNSILKEELKDIHAFNLKTLTPEQWEKQNNQ